MSASVAAIIVNYRTGTLTRAAAASVLAQPEVAEVVVVDNGSGDGSAGYLRHTLTDPRVKIVETNHNRGFGQGVNLGVADSSAPLLLILNSDATVMPGALAVLVQALVADEGIGVVAPAIYSSDGRSLQPTAYGRLPTRPDILRGRWSRSSPDETAPEWVSGVAMMVRREDFLGVGGFDKRFEMYFEDLDLCRRLRDRGQVARREPSAVVVHIGGKSWQSRTDQRECFQRSKAAYFQNIGATPLELQYVRLLKRVRTGLSRRGAAQV